MKTKIQFHSARLLALALTLAVTSGAGATDYWWAGTKFGGDGTSWNSSKNWATDSTLDTASNSYPGKDDWSSSATFLSDATIKASGDHTGTLTINGTLTISSGTLYTKGPVSGSGNIILGNDSSLCAQNGNGDVVFPLDITIGDGITAYLRGDSSKLVPTGKLLGAGTVIFYPVATDYAAASVKCDGSRFEGVVDFRANNSSNNRIYKEGCDFSKSFWNVYTNNIPPNTFLFGDAYTYKFGGFKGNIYDVGTKVQTTLQIGGLNQDSSISGIIGAAGSTLVWADATATLTTSAGNCGTLAITNGGSVAVTATAAVPSSALNFKEKGGYLVLSDSSIALSLISKISTVDANAVVGFSNAEDMELDLSAKASILSDKTIAKRGEGRLTLTGLSSFSSIGNLVIEDGSLALPKDTVAIVVAGVDDKVAVKDDASSDGTYDVYVLGDMPKVYTWTGNGGDTSWSTPGNWNDGDGQTATSYPGSNDAVKLGENAVVTLNSAVAAPVALFGDATATITATDPANAENIKTLLQTRNWAGTFKLSNYTLSSGSFTLTDYGNANSTIELAACTLYQLAACAYYGTVKVSDSVTVSYSGSSDKTVHIAKLSGTGTLTLPSEGTTSTIRVDDMSRFEGSLVNGKRTRFSIDTENTNTGTIWIGNDTVVLGSGATWSTISTSGIETRIKLLDKTVTIKGNAKLSPYTDLRIKTGATFKYEALATLMATKMPTAYLGLSTNDADADGKSPKATADKLGTVYIAFGDDVTMQDEDVTLISCDAGLDPYMTFAFATSTSLDITANYVLVKNDKTLVLTKAKAQVVNGDVTTGYATVEEAVNAAADVSGATVAVVDGTVDSINLTEALTSDVSISVPAGSSISVTLPTGSTGTITVNKVTTTVVSETVDITSYYTAESLAVVNGKIEPQLADSVQVGFAEDESTKAAQMSVEEGNVKSTFTLPGTNVKKGLYYGVGTVTDPDGTVVDVVAEQQAPADGETISLAPVTLDFGTGNVLYYKWSVSDTAQTTAAE